MIVVDYATRGGRDFNPRPRCSSTDRPRKLTARSDQGASPGQAGERGRAKVRGPDHETTSWRRLRPDERKNSPTRQAARKVKAVLKRASKNLGLCVGRWEWRGDPADEGRSVGTSSRGAAKGNQPLDGEGGGGIRSGGLIFGGGVSLINNNCRSAWSPRRGLRTSFRFLGCRQENRRCLGSGSG